MPNLRPFQPAVLAAGGLACVAALVTQPAAAGEHAASRQLTPYTLVSNSGLCVTAAAPAAAGGADLDLSLQACGSAAARQTFYVLQSTRDVEAVPQRSHQQNVRIALVDGFDHVLQPAYNLLRVAGTASSGSIKLTSTSTVGAPRDVVLQLMRFQQLPGQWVPVGNHPEGRFGVAGERQFRYGSDVDRTYAPRTLRGLEVAGSARCDPAQFPVLPPSNHPRHCAVLDVPATISPMQAQFLGPDGTCMVPAGTDAGALVTMGSCSLANRNAVWSLQPAAYLP